MSKLEKIQEAVEKKKVKKVAKFTDDADSTVRAAAFEALGAFPGDEYALEICQNTIRDSDPAVRPCGCESARKNWQRPCCRGAPAPDAERNRFGA